MELTVNTNGPKHRKQRKQFRNAMMSGLNRLCVTTKKKKLSESAAKRAAGTVSARESHRVNAYHCKHCGRWHIGHVQDANRESKYVPGLGRIGIRHFS